MTRPNTSDVGERHSSIETDSNTASNASAVDNSTVESAHPCHSQQQNHDQDQDHHSHHDYDPDPDHHQDHHQQASSGQSYDPRNAGHHQHLQQQTGSSSSSTEQPAAAAADIRGSSELGYHISNAVDIDEALLSPLHRHAYGGSSSSSSKPVTYKDLTADDHPAAAAATGSSSSSRRIDRDGNADGKQQPQQHATNELAIDDVNFIDFAPNDHNKQQQQQQTGSSSSRGSLPAAAAKQQQQQIPKLLGRPVGGGMPDFPSGELDLVKHLNLDGIFLEHRSSVTHDVEGHLRQQQQQQQQDDHTASLPLPLSARHPSSSRKHKQQQQQQKLRYSQPRPHPLYFKQQHVKTHFKATTSDGWKLHLIRTQVLNTPPHHHHPVILCPGLGSSGAYSFDLSPNVSLADYLAGKGWDVWTCELRGNGMSDKPRLFSSRSRWWTIDDYVEKDVPTIIRFVLKETHSQQVHFLGHSMGGMILCGVMARVDHTTAKIRSCIAVGSGLFLEESWWRLFERFKFAINAFWIMPSGALLRNYGNFMFGPWAIPYIDMLYFWPSNVEPQVGRAMMRRNFSNISVGVIQQIMSAFQPKGLLSSDKKMVYADPVRLNKVRAPALFIVGDRDRMCPAEGAKKTWQMFGSPQKRFVCLGPAAGFNDHYGHFDILMGKRVEREVFPILHDFLLQHDAPQPRPRL